MRRIILVFFLSIFQMALFAQQAPEENSIDSFIRRYLETSSPEEKPTVVENELFSTVVIHRFYGERNFEPAWVKDHRLPEIAYEMRYEIGQAKFDGLNPEDYHFQTILKINFGVVDHLLGHSKDDSQRSAEFVGNIGI